MAIKLMMHLFCSFIIERQIPFILNGRGNLQLTPFSRFALLDRVSFQVLLLLVLLLIILMSVLTLSQRTVELSAHSALAAV